MFNCKKCGACCRNVNLSNIYNYLDDGSGVCINYDFDKKICKIYSYRPDICNIDKAYKELFKEKLTIEEYYNLNYESCEKLLVKEKKMSDIKSCLSKKFREIFGYEADGGSSYIVSNARQIICQGKYKKEEILEIKDTSIMGNGKSGLVLTIDSICVKDAANSTGRFIARYEDIDYTEIDEYRFWGTNLGSINLKMKSGVVNEISIWEERRESLMDFIDYAIDLYKEEEKLEW